MDINATLLGQVVLLTMGLLSVLGWWVARNRCDAPLLVGLVIGLLALVPPLGLLGLLLVLLKDSRT
ncbi:hypothetical protein [Aeromonas schubertii]|uniref:hypothetical protein n=1 Tax=Aeromonas TaxID=642 RepID=UPI00067EF371|nr:hypothetical protein [Aeromonas schubertii]KUE79241.1 hypothetical protein ATO46_19125 [Aeromonas schubertii]